MQVSAIEIKYAADAQADKRSVKTCRTFISDKGVVRVTFERGFEHSEKLPRIEKYEYRISPDAVRKKIFSAFGWAVLAAEDQAEKGDAYWQLTIYQEGINIKLKGHEPPALFGDRLRDAVLSLVKYHREPILFG